jgi:hypothetical protein
MRRIAAGPANGLRIFVAAGDVVTDLSRQVWNRREDPSREEVALDQDAYVGVMCNRTAECASRNAWTRVVL